MKQQYQVEVWEYDRWSGPKYLYTKTFPDRVSASKWVYEYNAQNTEKTVPDYYTVAKEPRLINVANDRDMNTTRWGIGF